MQRGKYTAPALGGGVPSWDLKGSQSPYLRNSIQWANAKAHHLLHEAGARRPKGGMAGGNTLASIPGMWTSFTACKPLARHRHRVVSHHIDPPISNLWAAVNKGEDFSAHVPGVNDSYSSLHRVLLAPPNCHIHDYFWDFVCLFVCLFVYLGTFCG